MNGVAALRVLALADPMLMALVPPERVRAGVLPQDTKLPAISLITVSSIERSIPNPGSVRRLLERTQATIIAKDYAQLQAVRRALKHAAADKRPIVDGISEVVVLLDGAGPEFMDDGASFYITTQDFRISFNEPA